MQALGDSVKEKLRFTRMLLQPDLDFMQQSFITTHSSTQILEFVDVGWDSLISFLFKEKSVKLHL